MRTRQRHERGIALITMALWMAAFFGLATIAIDIGRVAWTANEVQTAADIAATAGATAVLKGKVAPDEARIVLGMNKVDGKNAGITVNVGNASAFCTGHYDFKTGAFSCGGPANELNAARAVATATVKNMVAGISTRLLGGTRQDTSTVQRRAVASFAPLSSGCGPGGPICLPIALGDCYFREPCENQSCPPKFTQVPSSSGGNNSAFTSFFGDSTNPNTIVPYLPAPCGGGVTAPQLRNGQTIQTSNGQIDPVCRAFECLYTSFPNTEFMIPVIQSPPGDCGGPINGPETVVGFATIKITGAVCTSSPKYISISRIFKDAVEGGGGGSCPGCGTGFVILRN